MHYVKQFKINGVDTKQVACIELQGVPNAATEGSVGVLGMDMSSPTHEVYRCVAVNGSVYTWELLSAGMSIISATITGEGGETKSFPYENLRIPNNYIIKVGDLILDSEGYLYQINSIGAEMCDTTYCGTHIGGIASGDKDYSLTVVDGKLQMVTEGGAVISNIDYSIPDGVTIHRDSSTGVMSILGIKTINGNLLRFFVGKQSDYDALSYEQQQNLFAIFTDDKTKDQIINTLNEIITGTQQVRNAKTLNGIESIKVRGNGTNFIYETVYPPNVDNLKSEGHRFLINATGTLPSGFSGHGFLDVDYFDGAGFAPSGNGAEPISKQTLREYSNDKSWVRTYNHLSGAWSAWTSTKVANVSNTDSALTIGIGGLFTLRADMTEESYKPGDLLNNLITDRVFPKCAMTDKGSFREEYDKRVTGKWQIIGFCSCDMENYLDYYLIQRVE